MIVLDASVVIAYLDQNDRHHERATEIFEQHAASGFRVHQLTLAEVLVGAVRIGRGNQLLDDLTSIGVVASAPAPGEPLILSELRATTALKMPDCCVLSVALHESLPLATSDDQLAQVARKLGVETLP